MNVGWYREPVIAEDRGFKVKSNKESVTGGGG